MHSIRRISVAALAAFLLSNGTSAFPFAAPAAFADSGNVAKSRAVEPTLDNLKICTYNIMFLGAAGNWDPSQRADKIAGLEALKLCDAIVFTEMFHTKNILTGSNPSQELLSKLEANGFKYRTDVIGKNPEDTSPAWDETSPRGISVNDYVKGGVENGGVAIVSKHEIIKRKQLIFPSGCGADHHSAKGAAYAQIKVGDKYANIIGTHLQADDKSWIPPRCEEKDGVWSFVQKRDEELQLIDKFVEDQNLPKDQMAIFAGDLNINLWGTAKSINGKTEYENLIDRMKLHPADKYLGWQYSFDTEVNTIGKYRYGKKYNVDAGNDAPEYLDYILPREGYYKPAHWNQRVTPAFARYEVRGKAGEHYPQTSPSDHDPVIAGDISADESKYKLHVNKVTVKKFDDECTFPAGKLYKCGWEYYGEVRVKGAQSGNPPNPSTALMWQKSKSDATAWNGPPTTPPPHVLYDGKSSDKDVISNSGFAIHVDLMDWDSGPNPDDFVAYGTYYWAPEDGVGNKTVNLWGEDGGDVEIEYTVSKVE
ncbi:sphingomyelin phosphodiesterase [Streptomyces albireticuli]|nr:sphingomyelin phosphodiesterase [Streptomyces albireticuli]